jgi:hypothetical protein
MTATISPAKVQTPAKVGAKTITLDVNYVGCTVSIAKTNERYFSVVARTGLRGMDIVAAQVWFDQKRNVWAGDYCEGGTRCYIGMEEELDAMLHAAANNVSWRGHENGQW